MVKYELQIRDQMDRYNLTSVVCAESLTEAIWKARQEILGWSYHYIHSVHVRLNGATENFFNFPQFSDFTYDGLLKKLPYTYVGLQDYVAYLWNRACAKYFEILIDRDPTKAEKVAHNRAHAIYKNTGHRSYAYRIQELEEYFLELKG